MSRHFPHLRNSADMATLTQGSNIPKLAGQAYRRFFRRAAFASFRLRLSLALCCACFTEGGATETVLGTA
jgi:hypothetical protein